MVNRRQITLAFQAIGNFLFTPIKSFSLTPGHFVQKIIMIHLAVYAIGARYGGPATGLVDILNAVFKDPRVAQITLFCSPHEKRLFKIPYSEKLIEAPKPWIDRNYLLPMLWFDWLLGTKCKRIGADILLIASNFGRAGLGIPHVTSVQQSLPFSEEATRTFRSILQTARISAIR